MAPAQLRTYLEQEDMWSYGMHLTPAGHEMLAALVFQALVAHMRGGG
jgi:hypothetical protein